MYKKEAVFLGKVLEYTLPLFSSVFVFFITFVHLVLENDENYRSRSSDNN